MAPATQEHSEWDFPRLRVTFGFEDDWSKGAPDDKDTEFFDVKFYPYNPIGADPIFAAVSKKHVVVCRLSQAKDGNPCEVVRVIRDDDPEALNCSCCWSKDAETERALLCISGRDAKVKVYNIKDGTLYKTLVGHGGEINDLTTSPDDPQIIASASDDTTVRIWSLKSVHEKQPCVCLLAGEGHSWNLLSVAFHNTGRYVLSAGHDQVINLWTVPDLPTEHVDSPTVVHYPHFSTSEVHVGLVDCVAFYGDLILSRACHEDIIALWRIEGFSSDDPPPLPSTAPTTYDQRQTTRSAFAPIASPSCPTQWTRLVQFETKGCGPQFFMRFSIYHAHGQHPILCFCNAKSQIMFWDMSRLTAYHEFMNSFRDPLRDASQPIKRPHWLVAQRTKNKPTDAKRAGELNASGATKPIVGYDPYEAHSVMSAQYSKDTLDSWALKYDTTNPHNVIKPHKIEEVRFGGHSYVGRQVAWSPGGEWCVIVGSQNHTCIFQRWPKHGAQGRGSKQATPASQQATPAASFSAAGVKEEVAANASATQTDAPEAIM